MPGKLVSNIMTHWQAGIDDELVLHSNGDSMKCTRMGKFENLKERMWFGCRSIANILSLALLVNEHCVYFDSAEKNEFLAFRGDGSVMRFVDAGQGLYVHNTSDNKVTSCFL